MMSIFSLRAAFSAASIVVAISRTSSSGFEETSPGSVVRTLYGRSQSVGASIRPRLS